MSGLARVDRVRRRGIVCQLEVSMELYRRKKEPTTALIKFIRVVYEILFWRHQESDYCETLSVFPGGSRPTFNLLIASLFGT
jgi:hypothetical protein